MKTKLSVLLLLAALIIATMLSSCKGYKHFNYEKYAAAREYPAWLKRHKPLFGWSDARKDRAEGYIRQARQALKEQEAEEKRQAEISKLIQQVEAINSKIK